MIMHININRAHILNDVAQTPIQNVAVSNVLNRQYAGLRTQNTVDAPQGAGLDASQCGEIDAPQGAALGAAQGTGWGKGATMQPSRSVTRYWSCRVEKYLSSNSFPSTAHRFPTTRIGSHSSDVTVTTLPTTPV
ncbi:unnamed protein product [Phytophthora fragariaefolia]|uniref:Unnamed protein product n=1 Tax=Phytophthora fragariaefolia TaxID=1490495 RepID=A0A9W7CUF4_9STRA|nr:unnamed protein product [Phytophthora fragariaefolia]